MTIVIWRTYKGSLFPKNLSSLGIQTDYFEKVLMICADAVRVQKLLVTIHVRHCLGSWNQILLDRCRQENAIAPNNWRRMPSTGNGSFPLYVLVFGPLRGKFFFKRGALARWSPPLRPIRLRSTRV